MYVRIAQVSDPSLLTAKQVAELLNVSVSSVTRWVRIGELEAIRLPAAGSLRFRRSDIEALLTPTVGEGVA